MTELLRWLGELAQKSKVAAFACVVASLVMIGGPRYAPDLISGLPKEMAWVPWVGLAFCGSLLLVPLFTGVFRLLGRAIRSLRRWRASRAPLDQQEMRFLYSLGTAQNQTMHIGRLNFSAIGLSQLEVQSIASRLAAKGLIERHPWDCDLCSFSNAGRARALEIERSLNALKPRPLQKGDWVRHSETGWEMRVVETMHHLGPGSHAESLPVICEWKDSDGRITKSPFHPQVLEQIDQQGKAE